MKDWPWYYFVLIAVLIAAIFYMGLYKPRDTKLKTLSLIHI